MACPPPPLQMLVDSSYSGAVPWAATVPWDTSDLKKTCSLLPRRWWAGLPAWVAGVGGPHSEEAGPFQRPLAVAGTG